MLRDQMFNQIEQRIRKLVLPMSINFWDEREMNLGKHSKVKLSVRSPHALTSLANPSMGKLAKNYVEQQIDLEGSMHDIIHVGEMFCDAASCIAQPSRTGLSWLRQSRVDASKEISYHYDVSNDFYKLWLDRRMVYSCAYFKHPDDSLDLAQEQKLEHICRKLDLKTGEQFLDIGCGWGGLIFWAAENYGVNATGVTLSLNQYEYVQEQIVKRGLQDRCKVRLMDYRDVPVTEKYEKISSVGMFEHVGMKNLHQYFGKIYQLLQPGGLMLNHGITAANLGTDGLGSGISEFIEQYVFPGGELVHVSDAIEIMSQQCLECVDVENLRPHYAKTLWNWVENLEAGQQEAKELIGEKKFRIWHIYMGGSAHAFERGWMSLFQIVAGKPLSDGTLPYPYTRDHVYV
ncbi:class I SAM-dependent methyltransferase [Sulfurirhabdus autotrophica]|uniref:Cyclopropane-fatty-acyl-phospholipid synthase n=1 Tax=Sulfurirhabdus autotrophica TaxID=1706046 RepID=A0A4V2W332_9PROT|nr:class I SAM-dependent methyltransferase [Sulfurirhabdus autotrophica]TCV90389.1 cyclopropane-fatty-acyl-phospholipid synthase [Sulfurirhabdus autotrophica]